MFYNANMQNMRLTVKILQCHHIILNYCGSQITTWFQISNEQTQHPINIGQASREENRGMYRGGSGQVMDYENLSGCTAV